METPFWYHSPKFHVINQCMLLLTINYFLSHYSYWLFLFLVLIQQRTWNMRVCFTFPWGWTQRWKGQGEMWIQVGAQDDESVAGGASCVWSYPRRKQQSVLDFAPSTATESHTAAIDCSSARLLWTALNPAADTRKRRRGRLWSGLWGRKRRRRKHLHGASAHKRENKLSWSRHFRIEILPESDETVERRRVINASKANSV